MPRALAPRSSRSLARRHTKRVRALLVLLVALFASARSSVRAQQAEAAAEALFRAGRDASQRGDTQTACDRFRESYRLEPALGTLFNIATCELSLGKLSEAWRHFQDVAHALPAGDPRVAIASAKLAELDRRLARLTVQRSPGTPSELEVWLGDVQLGAGSFGVALPIDPGSYLLEARAPQREPRRYTLVLGEGEQRMVEVAPGPELQAPVVAPAAPTPAVAPHSAPGTSGAVAPERVAASSDRSPLDGRRAAAFALLGAGALAAVASATCAGLVIDRANTVDRECGDRPCTSAAGAAATDSGEVFWVGTWVSLGVALAASGAGALLLMTAEPATRPQRARAGVSFLPRATRRGAGAELRLRF